MVVWKMDPTVLQFVRELPGVHQVAVVALGDVPVLEAHRRAGLVSG
jgi:hypothetical protein